MTDKKACKVCNFTRQETYGVAADSLDELKKKGCEFLCLSSIDQVKVVLENDGTIVDDQIYFMCLPSNTKFMFLYDKQTWSPPSKFDGGTAWMQQESDMVELDSVDAGSSVAPWLDLAQQLKQDLTSIVLMSERDLELLVDAPTTELAVVMDFQVKKAEELQEGLQHVLDRREKERQSKELLQLYVKTVEKEDKQQAEASQTSTDDGVAGDVDMPDGIEADSASGFMSRTLMVLKGKTSPETRLSSEDLQMVVTRGVEAMKQVLGWDEAKTSALLQACEAELSRRLQQIQAMQSIRNVQRDGRRQSSGTRTEDSERSATGGT